MTTVTTVMNRCLRVLIVEDSEHDLKLLIETLRAGGYDVTWRQAASVRSMREALAEEPWDIVLADYTMPRFSGPEALDLILEHRLDLPTVIVSRTVDEDVAVTVLHMGATDYVMKRNLGRLVPAVERALREAEERRSRRQAEEALRASEERYRELIENANDIVFTTDLRGNFTSLNRAGEQVSGYDRDELRHMNMAEVLTPEGQERALEMIHQKLTDNRPTRYQVVLIARDGHLVPLEISTRLIYHNDVPVGIQGIARDTTERLRAEEELRSRERKQAAVADLGQRALASADLDTLFQHAVESVAGTLDLGYSTILELLPTGDRLLARAGVGWSPGLMGSKTVDAGPGSQAGYALFSTAPIILDDIRTESRFTIPAVLPDHNVTSGISVIIDGRLQPFGVLSAFSRQHRVFTHDDVLFMQAVANVLGAAIERRRLEDDREHHDKELATRVLQAQEDERKRIARELHDETAQTLSVLLAHLDLLEPRLASHDPAFRSGFERVGALARRALDETRALSHDLRPTILDDVGLVAALEWLLDDYEQTYGGSLNLDVAGEPDEPPSPEIEVALFRIAQEALSNCGKHAHARTIRISLGFSESSIGLMIEDDGAGFDPDRVPRPSRTGRLGLYGMRERASLLGGTLEVDTRPGHGTKIHAHVPVPSGHSHDRASARSSVAGRG